MFGDLLVGVQMFSWTNHSDCVNKYSYVYEVKASCFVSSLCLTIILPQTLNTFRHSDVKNPTDDVRKIRLQTKEQSKVKTKIINKMKETKSLLTETQADAMSKIDEGLNILAHRQTNDMGHGSV